MASTLTRSLRLPAPALARNSPLPHRERSALLGQRLAGHDLPLRSRVAGVIVLLYAQRVSRIVRLTVNDVIRDGDQILLCLGEPPSPVPTPFAQLLLARGDRGHRPGRRNRAGRAARYGTAVRVDVSDPDAVHAALG
jgi:hypothetical protein